MGIMALGLKTIRVTKRMKIGFFMTWIAATCIALVFALKPQSLQLGFEGADKVLHLVAFMCLAFIPTITFDKIRNVIFGIAFVLAIGITIELIQHYIPTRRAEFMDVVFDGVGVAIGTMIGLSLRSRYQSLMSLSFARA